MDLAEAFKYGVLVSAALILTSSSRRGPEISRGMTHLGTIVLGVSLIGWAVTSRPVAAGALASLATAWSFLVATIGAGCLVWGWRRHQRDRRIDAGALLDNRDDPLSRIKRQRAAQQIRASVAPQPATHRADRDVESAARAGRSHAMARVKLGIALMLVPLLFRPMREGALDGSPASLVALACIVAGVFLTLQGRIHWLRHTRREQELLDSRDRAPPPS